eukprot:CAMPEP_0204021298 /NCGR_PEP_ID=MMETSP0360-20130528/30002_1 /ASSEMBLY_ACC=CAM_ASM_000342 /TAXON_ID=268821 /ORGANISM="Scrippsiella Hangoei, Strain SHTV-5" /LENGTH=37 /DNA_ID= /DNA_START= /DNA_END= /DNA_ORIENTATION=
MKYASQQILRRGPSAVAFSPEGNAAASTSSQPSLEVP